MEFIVDIIIILTIALCTFIGYKRGLIKVAVNILGFFLAIIISLTLYEPISNFVINNTNIKEKIKQSISGTIEEYVEDEENEKESEEKDESKIISTYINSFIKGEKQKIENSKRQVVESVAENVAINIIKVGVAVLVFIIAKALLLIIKIFAEGIGKLPLIKQFNEAGGLIYGILQGVLIIYIVLAVISLVSPSLNDSSLTDAINNSIVGKYLYNNNIVLKIIFRN